MASPKTPKVSIIKSISLDEDGPFDNASLSKTFNETQKTSLEHSLYESTTSSLTDLPIPPTSTYVPDNTSPVLPRATSPTNWDYENYIEKPKGKIAEPRYVSSNSSQDYTARSFVTDQPQVSHSSLGISPAILGIMAYFFGFFGGLVIIILEKKNLFVVFHACQSMVVGVFAFIVQIVFIWSKSIYTLLWIVYLILDFFMIAKIIMDAPTQRLFKLPIIGDWCEYKAVNRIQQRSGGDPYRMEP